MSTPFIEELEAAIWKEKRRIKTEPTPQVVKDLRRKIDIEKRAHARTKASRDKHRNMFYNLRKKCDEYQAEIVALRKFRGLK